MEINNISEGIFTVSHILSPHECQEYIDLTEEIGYLPAPVTTAMGPVMMPEIRNNYRVILDDKQRAQQLWERISSYITVIDNWQPIGINERFRFYRYEQQQQFAPHMDGCYQRPNGERSLLTFMVYLNDGFEGGETDFFSAQDYLTRLGVENLEPKDRTYLVSATITPAAGMALLFRHELPHEGVAVRKGKKYVLRSDVMFSFSG